MRTVALSTFASACLLAGLFTAPLTGVAAAKPRVDTKERAIVRAINRQRSKHGLSALRSSRRLAKAADFHSWEMLDANYFAHTSRDGGSFDERVRRFVNKRALGETLAYLGGGCRRGSARQVVRMWMNSPPHRAILLSSTYRRVGVGKRVGSLGSRKACMVTADFSSKK